MNRLNRLLLLIFILLGFAWRVHGLTAQSLWRDEIDAIYFAVRNLADTLAMFTMAAQNGPLYFLTLRPWFSLVGTSEFALRYPSVLAGTMAVALLWPVARRLTTSHQPWYANVPLLAVLFLAFNPYQLWYSQEGKMYTIITVMTLFATWCWLQGTSTGGWCPWLGYLITVSLAIYCHLLMILIFPLHFIWFLLAWPQSRHHWRGYLLALSGLTLPYLPMVWWQWEMLTSSEKLANFNFTPLQEMLQTLLINHAQGFMPPVELLWLAPIFFLGLVGLVMGVSEVGPVDLPSSELALVPWRRYMMIISWLFIPIVTIYLLSLRQPIFTDRYIIWIAPAAMILLALGVRVLWRNTALLAVPSITLLLLYIAGLWLFAGWQQQAEATKYNLRSAVTYVSERRDPESLLILQIPHMEYSYRYYTSNFESRPFAGSDARLGNWAGGVWTNNGQPDEQVRTEVDQQMQRITAGAGDIWVLRSEVEMWDQRHLMDEWLEAHGEVIEQADFHGTQIRRYRIAGSE